MSYNSGDDNKVFLTLLFWLFALPCFADVIISLWLIGFVPEFELLSTVKGTILAIILYVPYAFNAWLTNIQKKAGKIGVMQAVETLDDPRLFAGKAEK